MAADERPPFVVLDSGVALFRTHAVNDKGRIMSSAFDPDNGILYVLEPWADGDQPIAHAWRLRRRPLLDLAVSDGFARLSFSNLPGSGSHVLEWTPVLTHPAWADIYGFGATGTTHDWSEPIPAGMTSRYYRLRQP